MNNNLFIIGGSFFALLILVWLGFLTYRQRVIYKRIRNIFQSTKKEDIYEIIEEYLKEIKETQDYAKKVEIELKKAATLMKRSIQKVGFIRYNPFGTADTGGNQSFSVTILDYDNNGFILTSIHGREGTRVYAKPVKKGKSSHNLSNEEEESLKRAINNKE
ncbi:DUF4446 family protein [Patescibacteria group bacterium]|nr:DUF4446 family protein [Patescibacteria group bacterium]